MACSTSSGPRRSCPTSRGSPIGVSPSRSSRSRSGNETVRTRVPLSPSVSRPDGSGGSPCAIGNARVCRPRSSIPSSACTPYGELIKRARWSTSTAAATSPCRHRPRRAAARTDPRCSTTCGGTFLGRTPSRPAPGRAWRPARSSLVRRGGGRGTWRAPTAWSPSRRMRRGTLREHAANADPSPSRHPDGCADTRVVRTRRHSARDGGVSASPTPARPGRLVHDPARWSAFARQAAPKRQGRQGALPAAAAVEAVSKGPRWSAGPTPGRLLRQQPSRPGCAARRAAFFFVRPYPGQARVVPHEARRGARHRPTRSSRTAGSGISTTSSEPERVAESWSTTSPPSGLAPRGGRAWTPCSRDPETPRPLPPRSPSERYATRTRPSPTYHGLYREMLPARALATNGRRRRVRSQEALRSIPTSGPSSRGWSRCGFRARALRRPSSWSGPGWSGALRARRANRTPSTGPRARPLLGRQTPP